MAGSAHTTSNHRRAEIFRPIVLVWLGATIILAVVAANLVRQFDHASRLREQDMVASGFEQRLSEYAAVVVPQVDWDDAVEHIDNHFNAHWVDKNIASYLFSLNGITRTFILDDDNRLTYASEYGDPTSLDSYRPFATSVGAILPGIRSREAQRPQLRPRAGTHAMLTRPIQATAIVMARGQPFILIASLVQPDFGTVLPATARSPVVVAALPIDQALLTQYGNRYQISNLEVANENSKRTGHEDNATVNLTDANGQTAVVLTWTPRRPGVELLKRLLPALGMMIGLFALLTWRLIGRSTAITSDLIASEARARHLAYHDVLTQLPNRAMMFDRLRSMLALSRRQSSQTAVHCLDLDRFKEINDTLGHHAGDELIKQVAERLVVLCRETETVARLGGDEFVILQPDTSSAGASHLALRILKCFENPFKLQFGMVEIGCSIGVTLVTNSETEPSEALRQADLALYGSKENGRNRITFFEPDLDAALRLRRGLEVDLRKALSDGSLSMAYQAQMDQRGHVASAEALVRWNHPERGQIPPPIFVGLAEETGLILDLGEFIFRRVFAETANWGKLRVAINVSAIQLRSPDLMAMINRLMNEFRIDPLRYEIEITETTLLGDDSVTSQNIFMLKKAGFTIALDDFGTGYSSLNSLKQFAIDKIKIDRSFIHNLEADVEAEALVDAIIKLARALKLEIVAEGVETEAQRERLLSCGCNHFQGYLHSRPVPCEEFKHFEVS
jgi:diguanylate cyclase (GGDEF)-like protein